MIYKESQSRRVGEEGTDGAVRARGGLCGCSCGALASQPQLPAFKREELLLLRAVGEIR